MARSIPLKRFRSRGVSGSDNSIIVLSAALVFALGFINSFTAAKKGVVRGSRLRLFIGVGILYIGLAAMAEFNSKLARNFAILVMITAVLAEGSDIILLLLGRSTTNKLNIFGSAPAQGIAQGANPVPGVQGAASGFLGGVGQEVGVSQINEANQALANSLGVPAPPPVRVSITPHVTTIRVTQSPTNPIVNTKPVVVGSHLTLAN